MKKQKKVCHMCYMVLIALHLLTLLCCTSATDDNYTPAQPSYGDNPPTIPVAINDHLYLASNAVGTAGEISCYEIRGADSYQWYKSTDGAHWEAINGKTKNRLQFTVEGGTVHYCIGATSSTGGVAYSNMCTIECGTPKTAKIGQIYYSDKTISSVYEDGKTAIGIVCDVNSDGGIKTIVSLEQAEKAWSTNSSGYSVTVATSLTDGSKNWKVIQKADPNGSAEASTNYPAFDYCSTYKAYAEDDSTWYLPARDELSTIYCNRTAINAGLAKTAKATALSTSGYYWSSSRFASSENYAWDVGFGYGTQNYFNKYLTYYVRPVACIANSN